LKKPRFPLNLAVLSMVVLPVLAVAQTFLSTGPTVTISGAPFQAERVGRVVQKLVDGTTITRQVRGRMARDSEGRVYAEEQDQTNKVVYVVALDPVSHVQLKWSSSSKTATSMGLQSNPHVTFPLHYPLVPLKLGAERPDPGAEPDNASTQDLGQKTIDGLVVTGTRTVTVVPVGKLGNDRELRTVHDVWFSEDLKLALLDTVDDPLTGQQTLELQGLSRAEPDPALFRLPEGYELRPCPGGGLAGGISRPSGPPPPPPPPSPPFSTGQTRIKVAESAQAALIINRVAPEYPPLARQAGVQGTVVLHAMIGSDGKIAQLLVLSGHPLLIQAALVAVRQWTYKPTLLDGKPVEVETTITVPFALDEKP
jgi:TonB family protein